MLANNAPYVEDLPLRLEELTPEWISTALSVAYPSTKVADVKADQKWKGTAISAKLDVSYEESGNPHRLPAVFVIKGGFDEKWRMRTWVALHHEVRFYAELAPQLSLNIPKCYFAALNDAPQGILILENLDLRPSKYGVHGDDLSVDAVASVLEVLAAHHADWWEHSALHEYANAQEPERDFFRYFLRPQPWDELMRREHAGLLTEAVKTRENAMAAAEALWQRMDRLPKTLLHGDAHVGNFFFDPDGRVGFLDWQVVFAGFCVHDMAWAIISSLSIDDRRAWERDLVKLYFDVLSARDADAGTLNDVWLAYRQNTAHAICAYGTNPPSNFPQHLMRKCEKKVYTAASDLELLKSLNIK